MTGALLWFVGLLRLGSNRLDLHHYINRFVCLLRSITRLVDGTDRTSG